MINDIKNRYKINWVGRCQYNGYDKMWGWFHYRGPDNLSHVTQTNSYVFWADTGKTLQFKKHSTGIHQIRRLIQLKLSRNYVQISNDDLESCWEHFYDSLNDKFFFHLLTYAA